MKVINLLQAKKNSEENNTDGTQFEKAPLLPENLASLIELSPEAADLAFDSLLPRHYSSLSRIHWTSVKIAKLLSDFLGVCDESTKFIDIGSGCGKLCITLSLIKKIQIFGVEQRKDLFDVSIKFKEVNGLKNVKFWHGNMLDLSDWEQFDIYYFYNPFQEHVTDVKFMRIDNCLKFDKKYFSKYTSEVFRRLSFASPGKKMITYHGYGGPVPKSWRLMNSYGVDGEFLNLWEKVE